MRLFNASAHRIEVAVQGMHIFFVPGGTVSLRAAGMVGTPVWLKVL